MDFQLDYEPIIFWPWTQGDLLSVDEPIEWKTSTEDPTFSRRGKYNLRLYTQPFYSNL